MASGFMIGTSLETLTDLEELATPLIAPSPEYEQYPVSSDLPSGQVRGAGLPTARWHFDYLDYDQWAQLRAFCTGKSSTVFIVTLAKELTITFKTFQAVMVWPEDDDISELVVKDVNIHFQAMEVQVTE